MKSTKYGFLGKWFSYGSVFYFLIAMSAIFYFSLFGIKTITAQIKFFLFTFLSVITIYSFIDIWLHPMISIEEDGVIISRFFIIRRKIKWANIVLKKKVRTFTRPDFIGLDPRYGLIIVKDATIFDRYAIILPFFKKYDEFISEIESKLKKEDVYVDKKYI